MFGRSKKLQQQTKGKYKKKNNKQVFSIELYYSAVQKQMHKYNFIFFVFLL